MKKTNHHLEIVVLATFFTFGMAESIAQTPPAYYSPVPVPANSSNPGIELIAPGAPPPLQQEVIIVAPSPAHVWIPGYWNWQNRWIWIPGQWVLPPRPGARWMGHQWFPHEDGNRYRMRHGEWR